VDTHSAFTGVIVSLSLGSPIMMVIIPAHIILSSNSCTIPVTALLCWWSGSNVYQSVSSLTRERASLLCYQDFAHPEGSQVHVWLPARSLLVLSGDARYVWTHAIVPRKTDLLVLYADTCNNRVPMSTYLNHLSHAWRVYY